MAPSYKQRVTELMQTLTLANAEIQVLRKENAKLLSYLGLVYRGVGASWRKLQSINGFEDMLECPPGFLGDDTLKALNPDIMTDQILQGLSGLLLGAGKVSTTLYSIQEELKRSDEIIQTNRDIPHEPVDLKSPLDHLENALRIVEQEDQKIRAQVRASELVLLESSRVLSHVPGDPEETYGISTLDENQNQNPDVNEPGDKEEEILKVVTDTVAYSNHQQSVGKKDKRPSKGWTRGQKRN